MTATLDPLDAGADTLRRTRCTVIDELLAGRGQIGRRFVRAGGQVAEGVGVHPR